MQECPRCGAHHKDDSLEQCPFCGRDLGPLGAVVDARRLVVAEALKSELTAVPLLSIPMPPWDYSPMRMVTAQSVTGTGLFAEVGSIFTDIFGLQSGSFQKKLQHGESLCRNALRYEAVQMGAHAIIGVDVDYSEVGGVKSMLMVCMTGTAIRLNDLGVLGVREQERIERAHQLAAELRTLTK